MEATIKEPNIKHFVRLLQCAARYGDDLCMHATRESWDLSVTNSSKSAFCLFTLSTAFFHRYRAIGTPEQQRRGVKCKLYVKSVLGVLGKASSVNAVELIHLKILDPEGGLRAPQDDDGSEEDDIRVADRSAQLEIKLVYHHGIIKKHFLHLQSSDFLRAIIDTNSAPCGFQIAAKTLREWLDHFNIAFSSSTAPNGTIKGDSQLAWRFAPHEVRVKNSENLNTAALMTEIKINVAEFQDYDIEAEDGVVDLALPMREFKATLQLADQFNMDLDFYFSEATQPLAMSSRFHGLDRENNEKQLFTIFCVIATTSCDAFGEIKPETNGDSRVPTVSVKTDSDGSARKRESSSRRPRASLSMTAQPPTRGPSLVTVNVGDRSISQRAMSQRPTPNVEQEPLFLPGASQTGSQRVQMSQAEVLEMAGIDENDMEAALDEMDMEEEQEMDKQAAAQAETSDEVPADWTEIDFDAVPPNNMSTQREDIAKAQAGNQTSILSSPRKSPRLHSSLRSSTQRTRTSPTRADRPLGRAQSSRSPDKSWQPDEDIFGPIKPNRSSSTSRSTTPKTSTPKSSAKPATLVPTETSQVPDEEEFPEDPPEPTQADGRKFQSLFDD